MNSTELLDKYLEGYCRKHEIDAETAKKHAIVKSVAEYYKDAEKDKISVTEVKAGCGGAGAEMGECK